MEKKRSKGITLFAWFYLIGSFLIIPAILTMKVRLAAYQATHFILPDSYYYVVQCYYIIGATIGLITGIGLLKLWRWARFLPIISAILGYIYSIIFHSVYTSPYTIPYFVQENKPIFMLYITHTIGLLWLAIIIYFFTRPKVKEQFK